MGVVANPWLDLPTTAPYVLPTDREPIERFNAKLPASSPFRIHTHSVIPEPYIGAATTAPVMILQLNPGYGPDNPASHADPAFRAALLANLRHEEMQWPFYFLDPRFRTSHPGGLWWGSRARQLMEVVPPDRLAERMAVIEWLPYRSQRYRPGCKVPSQTYGFSLVSAAIERGAVIVLSRSSVRWQESVPALRGYRRLLTLSSTQNVALTPNNLRHDDRKTPTAWKTLIDALQRAP